MLIGRFARDYSDCIDERNDGPKIRDMYFKALERAVITQQDVTYHQLINSFFTNEKSHQSHYSMS